MKKYLLFVLMIVNICAVLAQEYRFEVKTEDLTKSYSIDSLKEITFTELTDTLHHLRVEYMDSTLSDSLNTFDIVLKDISFIKFKSDTSNNSSILISFEHQQLETKEIRLYDLVKLEIYANEIIDTTTTGVSEEIKYQLIPMKNYPNPFNSETQIEFYLETAGNCLVEITNISGASVRRVDLGILTEGKQTFTWDCLDNSGRLVPQGFYTCNVCVGSTILFHKLIKL